VDYSAEVQLKSMARSLQQHIDLASELQLDFTAQLLAMAVMEITTRIHGISQQELHALCERVEETSAVRRRQAAAPALGLRSFERRARTRRGRM
jgi:hypothetical protein